MLCALENENAVSETLQRPEFGMGRFAWPGEESVDFHLPYGEMLCLVRQTGFEVEALHELQAPDGPEATPFFVSRSWARRWPCEDVWDARKRSDPPTTNTTPSPTIDVDPGAHGRGEDNRRPGPPATFSGATSAPGRSPSSPTSAIVLSQHVARRRGRRDDLIALLIEWPEPALVLGRFATDGPAPIELLGDLDHWCDGFRSGPRRRAVGAGDRLAGSGTHRQECLTRRQSAAIHDYPRAPSQLSCSRNPC
jgi:hypothetical protein